MTVYAIASLKFTDRAAYDRYQARFMPEYRSTSEDRHAGADTVVLLVNGLA
ncbi:MAG: hypothetical protein WAM92_18490 [Mycobacterium sp.]